MKALKKLNQFLIELEQVYPFFYYEAARRRGVDYMIHLHTHHDKSKDKFKILLEVQSSSLTEVIHCAWKTLLESKDKDVLDILLAMGEIEFTSLCASAIEPSNKHYEVTGELEHRTLHAGDVVSLAETPDTSVNYLIRVGDKTLHQLEAFDGGQDHEGLAYIRLTEVVEEG